mmetsp:Transcript_19847/g.28534  ORF Transcript_19847/g.28534 Transcript_19847/m.28534 type:complete len:326 (+) Transcript_19847:1-978(+)
MDQEIISLLHEPHLYTWLEIAFLIEGKRPLLHIDEFNTAAREAYVHNNSNLQTVLNIKTNSDISNNPQIVSFVLGNLKKKKKVNCLGTALVAYLIAHANGIDCTMHCSESHSWIETIDGTKIDVLSNIKAAQKSSLPLSIYENCRQVDSFGMCMLIITNDNSLSDEMEFNILHHYRDKLKHSWEFSKLFSLGVEYNHPDVGLSLLDRDSNSIELSILRTLYYINEEEDIQLSLEQMNQLLHMVTELCERCNINSDIFLYPKSSLMFLAEEFVSTFTGQMEAASGYEDWTEAAACICKKYLPSTYDKFYKALPCLSGKRRRIEKKQ